MELNGWYTDQTLWPSERSYALFRQWFAPELYTVLVDLGQGAIYDDEGVAAVLSARDWRTYRSGAARDRRRWSLRRRGLVTNLDLAREDEGDECPLAALEQP